MTFKVNYVWENGKVKKQTTNIMDQEMPVNFTYNDKGELVKQSMNMMGQDMTIEYSDYKYDDKGNPQFGFYTKKRKVGSVEIPAKSPEGMFEEEFIPNDLNYVIEKMNEYYG